MRLITHQCPNCSASIELHEREENLVCIYCGTSFSVAVEPKSPVPSAPTAPPSAAPAQVKSPIMKVLIPFFIFDFLAIIIVVPLALYFSHTKKKEKASQQLVEQHIQQTITKVQHTLKTRHGNIKITGGTGKDPISIAVNGVDLKSISRNPLLDKYLKDNRESLSPKLTAAVERFLKENPMPSYGPADAPVTVVQLVAYKQIFLKELDKKRRVLMRLHKKKLRWVLVVRPLGEPGTDRVATALMELFKRDPRRVWRLHNKFVDAGFMLTRRHSLRDVLKQLKSAGVKDTKWASAKRSPVKKQLEAVVSLTELLDLGEHENALIVGSTMYRAESNMHGYLLARELESLLFPTK